MTKLQTYGSIAGAILLAGLAGLGYRSRDDGPIVARRSRRRGCGCSWSRRGRRCSMRGSALYLVNFGDAEPSSGRREDRRWAQAGASLTGARQPELATKVDQAVTEIGLAQEHASRLNQDANSRAGEAARLLAEVLAVVPR